MEEDKDFFFIFFKLTNWTSRTFRWLWQLHFSGIKTLCALKLPCGPVAPTLLDVSIITSLMPIGEKYLVGFFLNTIDPKITN